MWWAFVIKEHGRWLFRGSHFVPLETKIDQLGAPLYRGTLSDKQTARAKKRVARLMGYLPIHRRDRFHDMMAGAGHPIERKGD